MDSKVSKAFNEAAEKYDIQRKCLIPMMDLFYKTGAELVGLKNRTGKILDLGAGTGLFTKYVIEKYPKADYILVDIAEQMLDTAKERFSEFQNVKFKVQDYRKGMPQEKYDAIISSLSIHHLESTEKDTLYRNIYNVLNEDGVFINADQVKGEDEESEKIVKGYHVNHIKNCSLSEEEKEKTYERMALDKMDTMTDQINMLKNAGFKSVDIYYKYYNFVVFRAKK